MKEHDLAGRARGIGDLMRERLLDLAGAHPVIGDIRGRGLFQAIELVADRTTQASFDPALKLHARIKQQAMSEGLLVYPMGGTIDGLRGDHVLLAPPFIVNDTELDLIVERLKTAVDTSIRAASPGRSKKEAQIS